MSKLDPDRPSCEACKVRPNYWDKHTKTPRHQVEQFAFDMKREGYERAGDGGSILRQIVPTLIRMGPVAIGVRGPEGNGPTLDGAWAPTPFVRVARRFDVKPAVRKRWLQQLVDEPDLQQALLSHLILEGSVLSFFGVRQRDLNRSAGYLLLHPQADPAAVGCRRPKDEDIWREAPP